MAPMGALASLFLVVMSAIILAGYTLLERGPATHEGANPLMDALRRIGRAAPVRPKEADRLRQQLSMAGYQSPQRSPTSESG